MNIEKLKQMIVDDNQHLLREVSKETPAQYDAKREKYKKELNEPVPGKTYALTGTKEDKCIMNGNSWAESEIKD